MGFKKITINGKINYIEKFARLSTASVHLFVEHSILSFVERIQFSFLRSVFSFGRLF